MKSLIALIAALTIGGVGGWSLGNQPEPQNQMNVEQNRQANQMEQMDNVAPVPYLI